MPRQPGRYARIAITLPRELLVAADRRARELDRSRSWVIAEAIRLVTAETEMPAAEPRASLRGVTPRRHRSNT